MIFIEGGRFFMGTDERGVEEHERPAHRVLLDAYCIDRTEVTVDAFAACVSSGACAGPWDKNLWADISPVEQRTFDPLCNVREPTRRGQHPANCVSWTQASAYCGASGKRLPREAEWEFAARGTDGRRYPWGDAEPTAQRLNACGTECVSWGKRNGVTLAAVYPQDDGWPTTAPVGAFPAGASPFGLLDMTGNVWEWVADRYGPYDAAERANPEGADKGEDRVVRGGAWNGGDAAWVRPTFRYHTTPSDRGYAIGFRCAANIATGTQTRGAE
jgi:formylglycine-generating enzyme required for sulfatase activity